MSGQVYLNGTFVERSQAKIDVEDRGFMFADGVYEVVRYYNGIPIGMSEHVARMKRSLAAIRLELPQVNDLASISDQLLQRQGLRDARVYWQVTRGSVPRDHRIPDQSQPTVLVMADAQPPLDPAAALPCIRACVLEDVRWHFCSIKSVMLLANVLAKTEAHERGCGEAILHRNGTVTEGSSTNIYIVKDGAIWTHPADQWILGGVTRTITLAIAKERGIAVHEQPFNVQQLMMADEVMLSGTTSNIKAIVEVDGRPIGAGAAGPVAQTLHAGMIEYIKKLM